MRRLEKPIPIILLSGFLGAGKTTALNYILKSSHDFRIGVLVNDFGAVNIDAEFIVGVDKDNTISLSNGCICCTIRDDLVKATMTLINRPDPPDYIFVEASGVADPTSLNITFNSLQPYVFLEAIVTLIDAEQVKRFSGQSAYLVRDQIRCADFVFINKIDLISPDSLTDLKYWVKGISPTARIFEILFGQIPLNIILGANRGRENLLFGDLKINIGDDQDTSYQEHDYFSSWIYSSPNPFASEGIKNVFGNLPPNIFRAKGILYVEDVDHKRVGLQVVGTRVKVEILENWDDDTPMNTIVFIGEKGEMDPNLIKKIIEKGLAMNKSPKQQFWKKFFN